MGTDEFDGDGLGVDEVDPWRGDELRLEKGAGRGGRDERKADLQRQHPRSPRRSSCLRGSGLQRRGKTWLSGNEGVGRLELTTD